MMTFSASSILLYYRVNRTAINAHAK